MNRYHGLKCIAVPRRCRHWGFTLTELMVAMVASAVLLVGMMSAILVASRATEPNQLPSDTIEASRALVDLSADLQFATEFFARTATTVEFYVLDRDNDGVPEFIRYEWSETPGDPLQRTYNGGPAVPVLDAVFQFALTYDLTTIEEEQFLTESSEVLLSSHTTSAAQEDHLITSSDWIGQYFQPSLPADATSWKVTRLNFRAKAQGQSIGVTMVQLRTPTADYLPGNSVLEQLPMYENTLAGSYTWAEFAFSNVTGLSPGAGLCLVLEWVSDAPSARIVSSGNATGRLLTTDGGSSWSSTNSSAMQHNVFGTYTSPGSVQVVTRTFVTRVGINLRTGDDVRSGVETSVRVFNAPEMTGL